MRASSLLQQIKSFLNKTATDKFHCLFYDSKVWANTFFLGVPVEKCPLDLWVYQEIIFEVKPDIIIESGTYKGGSALFLASICDLLGQGKVVTIDIEEQAARTQNKRIKYLSGSSLSSEIIGEVRNLIGGNDKVLVILDSDHTKEHVIQELRIYSKFVTKDSYIIVEDTNLHGHPVAPRGYAGPMEAVDEFLKETSQFFPDREKEKFMLTFNPRGYLRRR